MKFLLAPNAMKGALSALHIAAIAEKTLRRRFKDAQCISAPVADGGNGMLECLMNALGGRVFHKEVTGPIPSMKATARFGITNDNIGIIESAEAVGIHLLSPSPSSIAESTTAGVGELIAELETRQCKEIWIGLGGSAANDGGAGMGRALGIRFLDENKEPLKDGALQLVRLSSIESSLLDQHRIPVKILSDVTNPLLGAHGATFIFAQQKGATSDQLPYLEAALQNFAGIVEESLGKEWKNIPGSGAAGGLGFGLLSFCNSSMVAGIEFILDAVGFDTKLRECDAVITTEGTIDEQTFFGKGIAGIARRCVKYNKPLHVFAGRVKGTHDQLISGLHLASLTEISPPDMKTADAVKNAPWLFADALFHHSFS